MRLPLLLIVLASLAAPARAQVSVSASVDEHTVGPQETIVYTIEVEGADFGDVEMPAAPEPEGLALLQQMPGTRRSVSIVNGRRAQRLSFFWQYRPLGPGGARIGPARVTIAGRSYRTAPISIRVTSAALSPSAGAAPAGGPAPPADGSAVAPEDLFIRAVPSQTSAYQNEQVTVEYVLYARADLQLNNSRQADSWDAEGFWREELEVDRNPIPRTEVVRGLRYNAITLKRIAVFPTRTGRLRIDPLRIETEVYHSQRYRDPFDQFIAPFVGRFVPSTVASPPVILTVRPLPPGAPAGFRGAVGRFEMDASVDPTRLEAGEAVRLDVTIRGAGNLATLEGPVPTLPSLFEAYDPQVRADVSRDGARVQGVKRFTHVLVPRSGGRFTLPALEWSFFDPGARAYRTLRTEPVSIEVTGAVAGDRAERPGAEADIAGLMATGDWRPARPAPLYRSPWVYAALAAPLLLLGALYGYRQHADRLSADPGYARGRRANPLARRYLKEAEALLRADQPRACYDAVQRALVTFVGNRLNVPELGLTHAQLDAHLAAASAPASLRAELRRLLEEADQVRFSPIRPDHARMTAALDEAARLITELDRALAGRTVSA